MAGKSLHENINADGALTYYDETFRNSLEMHLPFLKENGRSTLLPVEPHMAFQNEYDFYSLLLAMNVPMHLHWITLRLNGMTSPAEYTRDMVNIYVPNPAIIDNLKSVNTTLHRIDS